MSDLEGKIMMETGRCSHGVRTNKPCAPCACTFQAGCPKQNICREVGQCEFELQKQPASTSSKDVLTRVREAAHALGNDPPNGVTTMQALTALHDAIAEIERLQKDRNECLEAFHILFRIFPEPK